MGWSWPLWSLPQDPYVICLWFTYEILMKTHTSNFRVVFEPTAQTRKSIFLHSVFISIKSGYVPRRERRPIGKLFTELEMRWNRTFFPVLGIIIRLSDPAWDFRWDGVWFKNQPPRRWSLARSGSACGPRWSSVPGVRGVFRGTVAVPKDNQWM